MLDKVKVQLGKGWLERFTIFEWKKCFSLYFHIFNTVEQDRFHTHAFNGLAIVLRGGYWEECKDSEGLIHRKFVGRGIRYIPRSYNHRLLQSIPNSWSILLAGPWATTWTEENDRYIRTLTWGRKEIGRVAKEGTNHARESTDLQ